MSSVDLQEATYTLALLMKKEEDYYKEHLAEDVCPTDPEELKEYLKKFEYIKANTREFANRMAALPQFFDVIESWLVCVSGKEGVNLESLNMASETGDVDDLLDRSGSLAQSVKAYIRDNQYFIVGMGAGEDGWDVQVRCNNKAAKSLCREIMRKYRPAIGYGLLFISRRFGEHRLPGLYNYEDARKLLKAYGDDIPTL